MSLLQNSNAIPTAGATDFYTHQIPHSVRMVAPSGTGANNSRLTRTFSTVDSNVHFTLNFWIKRSAIEGTNPVGGARLLNVFTPRSGTSGSVLHEFGFAATGSYGAGDAFVITNTNTGAYILSTNNVFRDTSAFYNIHIQADLDNGTASEKLKIFINGTEADYNVDNRSSYSSMAGIVAGAWTIGDYYPGSYPIQSYLAQWAYVDGSTLAPTVFSEEKNGVWIPKDLSSGITWGSAGHLLMFQDSSALGDDTSGEGNDWGSSNLSTHDQMLDTPTFNSSSNGGNFCTYNPLNAGSYATLSEGNLKALGNTSSDIAMPSGTFAMTSGKWYFERLIANESSGYPYLGLAAIGNVAYNTNTGGDIWAMRFAPASGTVAVNGTAANVAGFGTITATSTGLATATTGDIIGFHLDLDNRKCWITKNGAFVNSGDPSAGTNPQWSWTTTPSNPISFIDQIYNGTGSILNAGQDGTFAGEKTAQGNSDDTGYGNFYYAPDTGFLALCSGNASVADAVDPAQTDDNFPQKLFSPVLYTGNGSSQSVTGVGFQPDFVWLKNRNDTQGHKLFDSSRGVTKVISSHNNDTQSTESGLSAFGNDGFSFGGSTVAGYNTSSNTYASWNWRANGGTTSSGSGDLTSTHQVDPSGGFSIVKAVGDGGSGDKTVSHGLSAAPTVILAKNRDTAYNWDTYWAEGVTAGSGLRLNTSEGPFTGRWGTVNSSIFTCKDNYTWAGTNNYIYYCFTNVEGYCKAGSYVGNGNTDGTFVYTGFKPAFILLKRHNRSGDFWYLLDATRNPFNGPGMQMLNADGTITESSHGTTNVIDILSNGWKMRTSGSGLNGSGGEWVWLAMSHNPFKYATSR